jgi:hypothetical protein
MVVQGQVVNVPSDGSLRPVYDALAILPAAPPKPPPANRP